MMPTQREKDRRIAAAEKRAQAATEKLKLHEAKLDEAADALRKAERDLEWLRAMPVDDSPAPELFDAP